MPLIKGKSKQAFKKNIETEMDSGKPQKQALAIAYSMKRRAKKMAEGGETSTTGNKTKTGGSNPGGASTGGAGTVTITARDLGPEGIKISDIGGTTSARNPGGMDPSDEDDAMMMAKGGDMKSKRERAMEAFHGKKMAEGGQVVDNQQSSCSEHCNSPCEVHPQAEPNSGEFNKSRPMKSNNPAMMEDDRSLGEHGQEEQGDQGGGQGFHDESYMGNPGDSHDEYQDASPLEDMVGKIMKQRQQHFSKGGMVANQDKPIADAMPAEYDDLHLRDELESSYTGANSGDERGDAQEHKDREDMISQIMKSRKKKDRLPSPL